MITAREIANAANEWLLRHDVVEKDYVLGWLLAGVASHPVTDQWAAIPTRPRAGTDTRRRDGRGDGA